MRLSYKTQLYIQSICTTRTLNGVRIHEAHRPLKMKRNLAKKLAKMETKVDPLHQSKRRNRQR